VAYASAASALLIATGFLLGCSGGDPSGAPGTTGGAGGIGGASGEAGAGNSPLATVAFDVAEYPGGDGMFLRVPVSINGSPPVGVLLDTGSDGLRVFADALGGTSVDVSATPVSVEFGFGDRMVGHLATGQVSYGKVGSSAPIAFHLVESFECAPSNPSCNFSGGDAKYLTDAGIHGILGVSARTGMLAEIYSPFAQLDAPLSNGFVIRTGGFGAPSGEIAFGLSEPDIGEFQQIALASDGSQPNAVPAWRDDAIETCFTVAGVAVDPPCTDAAFDTGASVDSIYAPNLPPEQVVDGALAPNLTFEAKADPALDLAFTIGAVPTPSVDLVFIDDTEPFALLGVGTFFRYDVLLDLANGKLGFRPL
jgi:hypothetical protein